MARPSPAVERTTAILDFLAAHPNEPWTLSELARRLDLNKATAHSLLSALTDAGYLVRHPIRKDYALGPALIGVGRAALSQYPVVDFARPEMRRLADDPALRASLGAEALRRTRLLTWEAGARAALDAIQEAAA